VAAANGSEKADRGLAISWYRIGDLRGWGDIVSEEPKRLRRLHLKKRYVLLILVAGIGLRILWMQPHTDWSLEHHDQHASTATVIPKDTRRVVLISIDASPGFKSWSGAG
jgi:hypothetical protein